MSKGIVRSDELLNLEIGALKKLDHPNIIKIFETFESDTHFYIVSEYCEGGELFDVLDEPNKLSEKVLIQIMKQLFSAIA